MKPVVAPEPCRTCVEKLTASLGRKPTGPECKSITMVKPGCDCEECDREWAFRMAGIPMPPRCPSFDEAWNKMQTKMF